MTSREILVSKTEKEKEPLSKLCRVCMSKNDNLKCILNTTFAEELEYCTGINVSNTDGLPTKMCTLCCTTLTIAYKFKTLCLKSDETLRNVFKMNNVKNEIKAEPEEASYVDSSDFEYPEIETKHESCESNNHHHSNNVLLSEIKLNHQPLRFKKSTIKSNKSTKVKRSKVKTKMRTKLTNAENSRTVQEIKDDLYCRLCDVRCKSHVELHRHRTAKHMNSEFICEICGKIYKYRSTYYAHIKSHMPPTHLCDQCDYKTWSRADLNKHIQMHKGIKKYVCDFCTKGFHTNSNLHSHVRIKHGGGAVKKHACTRCDSRFTSRDKLRRHMDTHDNIKRFECELCRDRFARRCQWKLHLEKLHNIIIPRLRPGKKTNEVLTLPR